MNNRISWDEYFMNVALLIATRSSCNRLSVGAIIVKNNRIIGSGYNGSISGLATCDEEGHLMYENHCVRTIHAEMNALVHVLNNGAIDVNNSVLYVTHFPCLNCTKMLLQSGIKKIIYYYDYKNNEIALNVLRQKNVDAIKFSKI